MDKITDQIKKKEVLVMPSKKTVYVTTDGQEHTHLAVATERQRFLNAERHVSGLQRHRFWYRCNNSEDLESLCALLTQGEVVLEQNKGIVYPCAVEIGATCDNSGRWEFNYTLIDLNDANNLAVLLGDRSKDKIAWLERAVEYALNHLESGVIDNDSRHAAINWIKLMKHHADQGDSYQFESEL